MPQPPRSRRRTIWIPRAEPAGSRTARQVQALGHRPLVAPVLRHVAVSAPLPQGPFAGIVLTSARAVEALDARALAQLASVAAGARTFAVGARTAEAARRAGLAIVAVGEGDAAALASLVAGHVDGGRLLHVAGRERKAEPGASLGAAGFVMETWTTYGMEVVPALPGPVAEALARCDLDAVLHYSRRSAEAAFGLAEAAGRGPAFRAVRHHCLSADVAAPLVGAGVACHVVAARPNEAALLATLGPPGPSCIP